MIQTRLTITTSLAALFALYLALPTFSADKPPAFEHESIRPTEKGWVAESEKGDQPIEDVTAFCMDCHGDLEVGTQGKIHGPSSGARSHPVDQPYPENGTDLVPLTDLDKRLLLIEGTLSCITCHSPDTPDHRLVIPDAYGRLCISCHRK